MPMIETGSGAIHYDVCDAVPAWVENPEAIIFHHGIAANIHIWADWMPVLATRYRLIRFDMRGFGQSVKPLRGYRWSFDGLVNDLLKVADAATAKRFHLVGESIGGTAALACALSSSRRLLSVTLSNAAARGGLVSNVQGWRDVVAKDKQTGWAKVLMDSRFHPGALDPVVYDWYLKLHETCSIEATLGLADLLLETDLTPRLGEIKLPVLLLCPQSSPFVPPQVMADMHKAISESELQVFPDAKHGLPLSHGRACAEALRAFLARRCG